MPSLHDCQKARCEVSPIGIAYPPDLTKRRPEGFDRIYPKETVYDPDSKTMVELKDAGSIALEE